MEKGDIRVLIHETRETTGEIVHEGVTIRFDGSKGIEGYAVSLSYVQAHDLMCRLHEAIIRRDQRPREQKCDAQTCESETRTPTDTGRNAKSAWS